MMRSALARQPPALRAAVVARPKRWRAGAQLNAPATDRAPAAIRVAAATSSFLLAYAVLTVCHAAGHDPQVLVRLARIPLFARMLGSAIACAPVGLLAPRFVRDRRRALRLLPALLGASVVVTMTIIFWFA